LRLKAFRLGIGEFKACKGCGVSDIKFGAHVRCQVKGGVPPCFNSLMQVMVPVRHLGQDLRHCLADFKNLFCFNGLPLIS
jgi:hypothetical protein